MNFNPKAGERIPVEKMRNMRERYKKTSKNWTTESIYFGADTFKRLLEVPGVVGVRVVYGLDEAGHLHTIFVPVDANGAEIREVGGQSTIEEVGAPCPPFCPTTTE